MDAQLLGLDGNASSLDDTRGVRKRMRTNGRINALSLRRSPYDPDYLGMALKYSAGMFVYVDDC